MVGFMIMARFIKVYFHHNSNKRFHLKKNSEVCYEININVRYIKYIISIY